MISIIGAALIVLFAGFVRGVSGFGYALIATPLLTLVLDVKSAVIMNVALAPVGHVLALTQTRHHIDWKRAVFLSLGSIIGVPLGAFLLVKLDPTIIKLTMAVLVIPFSFLLFIGRQHKVKHDTIGSILAGFVGGAVGTATSFAGPPVVLFLVNQGLVREQFVGTLSVFFLVQNLASLAAFSTLKMLTPSLWVQIAILALPLFLGTYLGIKVLPKIKTPLFRRIVPVIVSVTAVVIITTTLINL